jgi:hypothetical protein
VGSVDEYKAMDVKPALTFFHLCNSGQTTTVTLYAVAGQGFTWGGITVTPEGVNAQGATIYSFAEPQSVVRVRQSTTLTLTETWHGSSISLSLRCVRHRLTSCNDLLYNQVP